MVKEINVIPKHLEFVRFATLKELFYKLITIEFLKDKIRLSNKKIEIKFHNNFVLTIKMEVYFKVYMNDIFYCNIEAQDIWEIMHSFINEDEIFIESNSLFGRRKIVILNRKQFEKKKRKLMQKQKIKIYTIRELIYEL
jgi:hypothetical protein